MPTDSHAWWSFAPAAEPPDAAAVCQAADAGRGALSRLLREARHRLGAARATTLLDEAGVGAVLRPARIFLVTSYQPRAIDDAMRLAFAIAGFAVETVAVEGLAEAGDRAREETGEGRFDCVVLSIAATGEASGIATVREEVTRVAATLAETLQCPVAIIGEAEVGNPVPVEGVFRCPVAPDLAGNAPLFDTRFAASLGTIPSQRGADAIADIAAGFAARIAGTAPKLLITDLDDTLWRGVAGETGDLALHENYAAALATLATRGLVIAAASRNEAEVARAALAEVAHQAPSGVPRLAALAVDWADKADLVADILGQLALAAEHTVVVDDDPVNCALVAARFPAMDVRRFADPDGFAAMLLADPLLAAEERPGSDAGTRASLYQRRAEVERLRAAETDAAAFLERLETRLTILPLDAASRPRAAELARRVNQFVLTAERPNEMELSRRSNCLDFLVRLDDVFGGHGIVGLVLADIDGEAAVIRNLYLSCRALQRRVETAMLAILSRRAAALGARRIVGTVEEMERNRPARGLFAEAGFRRKDGRWVLALDLADDAPGVAAPTGLTIIDGAAGS